MYDRREYCINVNRPTKIQGLNVVEFLRESTKKRYGIAKEFIADLISLPPSRNVCINIVCHVM